LPARGRKPFPSSAGTTTEKMASAKVRDKEGAIEQKSEEEKIKGKIIFFFSGIS